MSRLKQTTMGKIVSPTRRDGHPMPAMAQCRHERQETENSGREVVIGRVQVRCEPVSVPAVFFRLASKIDPPDAMSGIASKPLQDRVSGRHDRISL